MFNAGNKILMYLFMLRCDHELHGVTVSTYMKIYPKYLVAT